jgi:hypothetical protein
MFERVTTSSDVEDVVGGGQLHSRSRTGSILTQTKGELEEVHIQNADVVSLKIN